MRKIEDMIKLILEDNEKTMKNGSQLRGLRILLVGDVEAIKAAQEISKNINFKEVYNGVVYTVDNASDLRKVLNALKEKSGYDSYKDTADSIIVSFSKNAILKEYDVKIASIFQYEKDRPNTIFVCKVMPDPMMKGIVEYIGIQDKNNKNKFIIKEVDYCDFNESTEEEYELIL